MSIKLVCPGTFDGENRGWPCDYVYCPEEDVLYCNFCLRDEPPAPQAQPKAPSVQQGLSQIAVSASAASA